MDIVALESFYFSTDAVSFEDGASYRHNLFKCPICNKPYITKNALYDHIYATHNDIIPEDMSAAHYCFNIRNKKTYGTCVQCRVNKTEWCEEAERYNRFCSDACKNAYAAEAKRRMVATYGKSHILDDPKQQLKMQDSRTISGIYIFEADNGEVSYMGSYEKEFLELLDTGYGWNGSMITRCPHSFPYRYEGKDHLYIPDYFIPNFNLIVEIKDTTNTHWRYTEIDALKEIEKEKSIKSQKKYNYIKIINKDYKQFAFIIRAIIDMAWDDPLFMSTFNEIVIIPK